MATTKEVKDFELVIEKIVFDEDELDELKAAIRNFSKGIITSRQLKQNILNYRERMVKEILNFLSLLGDPARTRESGQAPVGNDQLRQEITERNELLKIVGKRISALVLKAKKNHLTETDNSGLESAIKVEIGRVFSFIRVNEWLDMCEYDDYQFFVKLYPKLEELYMERFGESKKLGNNAKDGKDIMANRMARLRFPEEIETIVVKYVVIRNNFQHTMSDISPSNLEQAQEVFVSVLIYLIISSIEHKIISSNREVFYSCLKDFFSKRLASNPGFSKKMLERLKIVFNT